MTTKPKRKVPAAKRAARKNGANEAPAGMRDPIAAAMIAYTRHDIMEGEVEWQMVALKTVAVALKSMLIY